MSPTATPDAPAVARTLGIYVPIGLVFPSSLNPRKHFNKAEDDDLVASVKANGIMEPLVVRLDHVVMENSDAPAAYEIIAGERRFKAAQAAGLEELPVIVREATDAQLIEMAFTENDQRSGMHPIDDANGFARWLRLDPTLTVEAMADRLGRPVAAIKRRMRLLDLIPEVMEAFAEDRITVSHAERIAKVPADLQRAAFAACFEEVFDYESGGVKEVLAPARKLNEWFMKNVRLKLDPVETQEEFPDLAEDLARIAAQGATVTALTDEYREKAPKPGDPLPSNMWTECKARDKGAQRGVFVLGRRRGQGIWFQLKEVPKPAPAKKPTTSSEPLSGPAAPAGPSSSSQRDDATPRENDERARLLRRRVELEAIIQAGKKTKAVSRPLLIEVITQLSEDISVDTETGDQITAALKLPARALSYGSDPKALAKAPTSALYQTVAVMVILRNPLRQGETFKALGVDLKKITAAVTKDIAAQAKKTQAAVDKAAKAAKKPAKSKKLATTKAAAKKGSRR
jgi:ParB/RepB/Spo0J family partition protein